MNKCVGAKQTEIKKVLTIVQQLAMHRPGVVYNPSVINHRMYIKSFITIKHTDTHNTNSSPTWSQSQSIHIYKHVIQTQSFFAST